MSNPHRLATAHCCTLCRTRLPPVRHPNRGAGCAGGEVAPTGGGHGRSLPRPRPFATRLRPSGLPSGQFARDRIGRATHPLPAHVPRVAAGGFSGRGGANKPLLRQGDGRGAHSGEFLHGRKPLHHHQRTQHRRQLRRKGWLSGGRHGR